MHDAKAVTGDGSAPEIRYLGRQWQPERPCQQYPPLAQDHGEGRSPAGKLPARRRWARGPSGSRRGRAHRVVVIGGGFAGLQAVRGLRNADVEVTLVDRRNFHLFQPLLNQVPTGALSPGEIAQPLRGILARQRNAKVLLADVLAIDMHQRRVRLCRQPDGECSDLGYDSLTVLGFAILVALGVSASGWALLRRRAPGSQQAAKPATPAARNLADHRHRNAIIQILS